MRKCHEDETCIGTLSKQDLTCSGSDDCKAAYIGTLGTVLQVQCTCRTITQSEESLCEIFQHMLHRKSCFSKFYIHIYATYGEGNVTYIDFLYTPRSNNLTWKIYSQRQCYVCYSVFKCFLIMLCVSCLYSSSHDTNSTPTLMCVKTLSPFKDLFPMPAPPL